MNFADSNILFYCYDRAGDTRKRAIALSIAEQSDLCFSSQVINEVALNLKRKAAASEDYLQRLVNRLYDDYVVLEILREDIIVASELRLEYKLSYWDSLIVATALRANAQVLYSEDMQDGLTIRERTTIRNPFLMRA